MSLNNTPTANPGPKLGQGSIIFQLGNETYEMKPTINAMRALSTKYGGLMDVIDKISKIDPQVIEDVLIVGLGPRYQGIKQRAAVMEKVWAAGLTDDTGGFALMCQRYVVMLMRGGKPLDADKDEDSPEAPYEGNPGSSS